jgi:D-alanyl-D-alanine dipeptidase
MIRRLLLLALLCVPAVAFAQTRPASFVDVTALIPDLVVDLRYATPDNFIGTPIDGYEQPVCLLTREAAQMLALVQADLKPRGLGLKVFDCYRPTRAVAHFLRWARDPSDQKNKAQYFPDVDKRDLFRLGYLAARSGHSRGSTVDLTLVTLADKRELDMGTPYDFLSPRSALSDTSVSAQARANRMLLAETMRRLGFRGYSKEWWHFTLNREPFPDSYFDFPVR